MVTIQNSDTMEPALDALVCFLKWHTEPIENVYCVRIYNLFKMKTSETNNECDVLFSRITLCCSILSNISYISKQIFYAVF